MSTDVEEINPFCQYTDYDKIESHIEFSKQMFLIDKKGKHILSELDAKKSEKKKRSGASVFTGDVDKVYMNLVDVLNVRRFSHRLFFSLQSDMDELLFKEISKYEKFYIEDEAYDLTQLYFDQSAWIQNQDIQTFQLDIGFFLDLNEAMILVCYLREYEDFLFNVEEYINDLDEDRLKRNITKTVSRLRYKLKTVWDIVISLIVDKLHQETK